MYTHVYIIALHAQGKIAPETYEAVSFARDLGAEKKTILVLGTLPQVEHMARELAERTGIAVTGAVAENLGHYSAEAYKSTIRTLIEGTSPFALCIPHTAAGYDFAPGLATALEVPCITAVEGLSEGSFIRSLFGGKIRAHVKPSTPSCVVTVLPGAWQAPAATQGSAPDVTIVPAEARQETTVPLGLKRAAARDIGFADAEVIVSVGRGIGSPQNLSLIRDLAALFPKSAIGATRAVCDLGWLGYRHQIGSTGTTVSPRAYIACGISGAIQHLSGMRNSQVIIAINTDPHAAIFRVASCCIVEDLTTFIPVVIDEYTKRS